MHVKQEQEQSRGAKLGQTGKQMYKQKANQTEIQTDSKVDRSNITQQQFFNLREDNIWCKKCANKKCAKK